MHPIDLLTYYREHLHVLASGERRDPDFCRIALQLCRDFPQSTSEELSALTLALFSVLKQANWSRKGPVRVFGPVWLSYDMAHSSLGPFRDREQVLQLASSIASTAKQYEAQLFGNHSSASSNQRQLKVAILFICMAIQRGTPQSYFAALPQLGPQA